MIDIYNFDGYKMMCNQQFTGFNGNVMGTYLKQRRIIYKWVVQWEDHMIDI